VEIRTSKSTTLMVGVLATRRICFVYRLDRPIDLKFQNISLKRKRERKKKRKEKKKKECKIYRGSNSQCFISIYFYFF
jgi:hypothetical protein